LSITASPGRGATPKNAWPQPPGAQHTRPLPWAAKRAAMLAGSFSGR